MWIMVNVFERITNLACISARTLINSPRWLFINWLLPFSLTHWLPLPFSFYPFISLFLSLKCAYSFILVPSFYFSPPHPCTHPSSLHPSFLCHLFVSVGHLLKSNLINSFSSLSSIGASSSSWFSRGHYIQGKTSALWHTVHDMDFNDNI